MLALPPHGPLNCAITKFHCVSSERSRLWELAEEADAQGKSLDNVPVALSVNGSDVFVRESIRVLRDTGDRQIIGYLGFMIDITNEQRYQRLFEHLKKNGEFIFASISSVAIIGVDGSFDGREGTLVDITNEEHYRRSLQNVPVGFYEARTLNNRDIVRYCNLMFAKMHDCATESEVIGHDLRQFYASPEDYHHFIEELHAKDTAGLPLQGYALKIKTSKGRQRLFEVNTRLLKDRNDKIVGRMGW